MLRLLRIIILVAGFVLYTTSINAQLFTNAGTDFWFAFTETRDRANAQYWVNITSNASANGTIEIPGTGFNQNFVVAPGQVLKIPIPSADANILGSEINVNRGIHITSNNDIVVFAVTLASARHEASLVLPNIPGKKRYRVMSHFSELRSNTLYESEFNIVSGGDTVIVDITPTADIAGGRDSGVTYRDTILPNHVYQAQADSVQDDLTGTLIESVNDNSFYVYSGNVWSSVVCSPGTLDPLYEAMMPTATWGKDYFVIPTPVVNLDYVKIVADEDSTEIFKDGTLVKQLKAGEYYDDTVSSIHNYTSNKPISLGQFMVTGQNGCSRTGTDPSMIMLNATEQMFLDSISFFAVDTSLISNHYVHTLTRTSDTGLMFLDSVQMVGWTPFPQNADYSYKTTQITPGYHRLETKGCGFIAYSMGFGNVISYGYAAGVSLVDLSNTIQFSNAINGSDTICLGDTVQFQSVSLERPLAYLWDFGDGSTDTVKNPQHAYSVNGTYIVSLTTTYSCGQISIQDTVEVPPAPIADLGPDTTLCQGDTLVVSVNTHVFDALWKNGSMNRDLRIFQSGTYWVQVSNFCGASADTVVVSILNNSLVNAGEDTALCQFTPFILGSDSLKKDLNYTWFPDTLIDSARKARPIFNSTVAGNFSYIVSLNSANCILSDTIEIEVKSNSPVEAGEDKFVCNDTITRIKLGGSPTGQSTSVYAWGPADKLLNANSQNPTTKDPFNRTYYLLSVDTSGCQSVDSVSVYTFSYSVSGDSISCGGDTAMLSVDTIYGAAPFKYQWSNSSDLSSDTARNPKAYPSSSKFFTVTVSDASGCVDSTRVFVPVLSAVSASFETNAQIGCEGGFITAVALAEDAINYSWKLDGQEIGTNRAVQFDANEATSYELVLEVLSANSCVNSSSEPISLSETDLEFNADSIANVFTPNGDGINDLIDFSMGNYFGECSSVQIFNRWGAMVFESTFGSPKWDGRTFVGNPCQEGVYFYKLEFKERTITGYVTLMR